MEFILEINLNFSKNKTGRIGFSDAAGRICKIYRPEVLLFCVINTKVLELQQKLLNWMRL